MNNGKLHVYFVLGEDSGDALGADLLASLRTRAATDGFELKVSGLVGSRLTDMGMTSLFDIEDIAVMGVSAVLARLPTIVRRVYQTVADIRRSKPDVIVLIDSPDFTHAVAKRVRPHLPDTPIINYVCPSVWAWRSGRAVKMKAYVDHVLTILPFEPDALQRLNGPPGTYVGHALARKIEALEKAADAPSTLKQDAPTLLVLPGSRGSELNRMLQLYGETLQVLRNRGVAFHPVIPAVSRLKARIEAETAPWSVPVEIVDAKDNDHHFANASAALATSGTVALELALHGVPMVTGYKVDPLMRPFVSMVKVWSALLPNLILDRLLVPEEINELVMPERMARHLETLLSDSPMRVAQLDGFQELKTAMRTSVSPGERSADIVIQHARSAQT